jgi:hypothetical protein
MNNNQQKSTEPQATIAEPDVVENSSTRSRRRWVAGAGLGAVLLSVKTGSALAQGTCASPSGFKSIEANPRTSHRPQSFDGACHSQGFYNGQNQDQMQQYKRPFHTLAFHGFSAGGGFTTATTLRQVITAGGGGSGGEVALAKDLITVFLDIKLGYQNVLTETDVKDMWARCFGGLTLSANSRFADWLPTDIRDYLDVYVGNRKPWPSTV